MNAFWIQQYSSYELGRILDHFVEAAKTHPRAPGLQVLRAAATAHLTWDAYWHNCWKDPDFFARYTLLRDRLAGATKAGKNVEAAELIPILRALLDILLANDARNP